jgi:hypothetical protein
MNEELAPQVAAIFRTAEDHELVPGAAVFYAPSWRQPLLFGATVLGPGSIPGTVRLELGADYTRWKTGKWKWEWLVPVAMPHQCLVPRSTRRTARDVPVKREPFEPGYFDDED